MAIDVINKENHHLLKEKYSEFVRRRHETTWLYVLWPLTSVWTEIVNARDAQVCALSPIGIHRKLGLGR